MSVQDPIGLAELADRAAIEELLARYVLALDVADVEATVALFTESGEFHSHDHSWVGPDRLRRLFSGAPPGMHLSGRALIGVRGDQGSVRTQLVFFPADLTPHRLALYDDVVTRVDGRWRFRRRDCRYLRRDGTLSTQPELHDTST